MLNLYDFFRDKQMSNGYVSLSLQLFYSFINLRMGQ